MTVGLPSGCLRQGGYFRILSAGHRAPVFLQSSYLHCVTAPTCTMTEYKSGTRKLLSSLGYTIVADFGDQYTDLLGGDAGIT